MADSTSNTLGDVLIPVVNKLQDIFSQVTVDLKLMLPQVAVVGSQSSGKSSVLEALVGRDFLPRGSDIVTRRPLVLQLVKTPAANGGPQEWGEFLHAPGKVFSDFDRIRQEIQQETERLVGTNKNVSDKPIRLKIFSPHVLTMTLVDLPGMTKVPVGDQPSNIEQRIREMVLEYIRQPSCIILAVSPANVDLVNSDALQLAQMVDPEGARTIGVLTKLDIMDRGTHAAHILRNAHIPLRLGYVGLVLRCQEDIIKNRSMAEARRAEEAFFAGRQEYAEVSNACGVAHLARRLNAILVDHIKALLPGLRRRIEEALEARRRELSSYGEPLALDSKGQKGAYLLQLLCDYAERFAAMLDGRHQDLSMQTLSGGARIRHVFNDEFGRVVTELTPVKEITDDEICTVIKNGAGVTGNLLVPQEPFELLVRRALAQLLQPCLSCKDRVHQELTSIAEKACPRETIRFPGLRRQLSSSVLDFIKSGAEPAERMIRHLLDCENDYINCDHPEFIGGRGAIRAVMQERSLRSQQAKAKEGAEVAANGPVRPKANSGVDLAKGSGSVSSAAGGMAPGLKSLPDTGHGISDELLSRTRRRSDDGSSASVSGAGGAGVDNGSSSWFSWFSKSSDRHDRGHEDGALLLPASRSTTRQRSEAEEVEVEVIRKLVDSYFCIVRKSLLDQVPKAIMHFMVNNTKRGLQQHLIKTLYSREEVLDDLLTEREEVVVQRRACQEALGALSQAVAALEELPGELTTYATLGGGEAGMHMSAGHMALERNPSMLHAAKAASAAVTSLTAHIHV